MTTFDGRTGSGGTWETWQPAKERSHKANAKASPEAAGRIGRREIVISHSRRLFLSYRRAFFNGQGVSGGPASPATSTARPRTRRRRRSKAASGLLRSRRATRPEGG